MRIALAGSGDLAVHLMKAVLLSSHKVVALLQNGRTVRGAKRRLGPMLSSWFASRAIVSGMARRHGVPILYIDTMSPEELSPLAALQPDVLLVGGFSIILRKPLLALPRIGCINCHSSLLPKHRGPNPFTGVLLANETQSGVTFHIIDEGIDTGDILAQFPFPIGPADEAGDVFRKALDTAARHVVEILDRVEAEGLYGTPQDHSQATYDRKLTRGDLFLDWKKPAADIQRMIRACVPFMLPRFRHRSHVVYVRRAQVRQEAVKASPGTVVVASWPARIATGEGSLEMVQAYSAAPIPWRWPAPWLRPALGETLE